MEENPPIEAPAYRPPGHKMATPVQQKMLSRLMKMVKFRSKPMHKLKPRKKKVKIV